MRAKMIARISPRHMRTLWKRFVLTLEMIKFEHSVFALPFAGVGALLALRDSGYQVGGTRLEALVDRRRDGRGTVGGDGASTGCSTRKSTRATRAQKHATFRPAGCRRHSPGPLSSIAALVFVAAARMLNPLCFRLAPGGSGRALFLFVHEALHHVFSPGPRTFRSEWLPRRPGSRCADRSSPGILLLTAAVTLWTAGLRHHLFLPGL